MNATRCSFRHPQVARGLAAPLLSVTDGTPGLCTALDQVFDDSARQRCLVHRCRNVISKVSAGDQDQVKADFWHIFDIDETTRPARPHGPRPAAVPSRSPTSGATSIPARSRA